MVVLEVTGQQLEDLIDHGAVVDLGECPKDPSWNPQVCFLLQLSRKFSCYSFLPGETETDLLD